MLPKDKKLPVTAKAETRVRRRNPCRCLIVAALSLFAAAGGVQAAEIKSMTAVAIEIVLREIGAEFERATGHKINMVIDLAPNFRRQINAGEPFDVALFSLPTMELLLKDGKLRADSYSLILSAGIGVAVRKGAPKPDISSVEAFKRALLEAKSIAYLREGPSGVYLAGLLQRLGIAEQLKAKTKLADTDRVSIMIAEGEAELGVVIIPNILNIPGAELVGPLPPEIQSTVYFAGGVSASAKQPGAAMQLIQFLRSPRAIEVIRAKSMSPE
jgi:molybdate transport system substrate-binding protein